MLREMAEQPEVLARLLSRRIEVGLQAPAGVIIVARGSSDHAAVYGRYLLELATRRPVALAAPSLFTRYGAQTDASGWLVVGVSQSGKTPEIVDVVERLRATGGHAIAITNDGDSPLAEAAETVIELGAGAENAVPATKTFTAQMAAFAVLADALGDVPWAEDELARGARRRGGRARRPGGDGGPRRPLGRDRPARGHRARVDVLRRAGDRAEGA